VLFVRVSEKKMDPLHAERYTDRLSQVADRLHHLGERDRPAKWEEIG
jgi:hypothetical protein